MNWVDAWEEFNACAFRARIAAMVGSFRMVRFQEK
jgi:hypothetical protein